MGRQKIHLNREILPDFDDIVWKTELERFGIALEFLLSDGIIIEYDDEVYESRIIGQDGVEFYNTKDRSLALSYVENFGNIEFYQAHEEEPIIKIPIIDL